jgi:NitT/TauT family transport system ATP-binding protein
MGLFTAKPKTEAALAQNGHRTAGDAPAPAKIRLEGVSVTFALRLGQVSALRDVTLAIQPGEFVCLVGPSGCGKSTLLNIIAGLLRADTGTVYKDERPIDGAGPDRAVIFQEAALFPWLTAAQNVEFALKPMVRNRRERRVRALEQLQRVHLSSFAHSYPHELSGGMRQRVAIARALAMDPDILLMDEPFAALDAQTRDLLIEEVQRLWLETRKTVVFVTHNVMEAVTLGDRVLCMGTRPGCIKQELPIRLSRPRVVEDPDTARLAARIVENLRDEIAKIVQEESDLAEADWKRRREGDADGVLSPGAGVMGDGI